MSNFLFEEEDEVAGMEWLGMLRNDWNIGHRHSRKNQKGIRESHAQAFSAFRFQLRLTSMSLKMLSEVLL